MNVPLTDRRLALSRMIAVGVVCEILFLLAVASERLVPQLSAQSQSKKPSREVIRTVKPEYPAIIKSARIEGTVRLIAIVLPNGTVSRVQMLGGNPILAESVTKAVMKWRYVAAATETREEVIVIFSSKEVP